MNTIFWLLFLLLFALVWLRINKYLFRDLFSPFNLLLLGWVGPLLLGRIHLSLWQHPWSLEISLLIWCVTCSLVIPSLIFNRFTCRLESPSTTMVFARTISLFQNGGLLAFISVLFLVSFAGHVKNEFIDNPVGIPLITYIQNPDISRASYHLWGTDNDTANHSARILSQPLYLLATMLYMGFRVNQSKRRKFFLLFLVILYPITSLLKLSRIELTFTFGGIVFVEYYYQKYRLKTSVSRTPFSWPVIKKWSRVAFVILLLTVAGSVGLQNFQRIRGASESHQLGSGVGIYADVPETFYGLIVEGYAYFALPFENFVNYYESYPGGYNVGIGFFHPLLSIAGQGKLADSMLDKISFAPLFGYVNTYPFITIIYPELGIAGILIVPVIYSLLVNFIYIRFRTSPTFTALFIYIVVSSSWVLLFSAAGFTNLTCYLNIFFVVFLSIVARHFFARSQRLPAWAGNLAPANWNAARQRP